MAKSTLNSLSKKRKILREELCKLGPFLRGSIVEYKRICGRSHCRCQRGYLHSSTYFSSRIEKKTQMLCLPKRIPGIKKEAISCCFNYKRAKEIMEELTLINLRILREKIHSSRTSKAR